MAPPIITPDTFNTPIYHYLVVLKNLADDFVAQGETVAPISVVALPSNVPHASGTGFYDNTTGKSTNPTIAAFLCPSGILTAPASSFGMDYIRLFPGQSSSITFFASSLFSGIPSQFSSTLMILSSAFSGASSVSSRYHILSGVDSKPIFIFEEKTSARNLNISRNWMITDFDYTVGMYKKLNKKISNIELFGDYFITSGNFGQKFSYNFYLRNNFQNRNIYLPEFYSYQTSTSFLSNPVLKTESSTYPNNGTPSAFPNYTYGQADMYNKDIKSVADVEYTFGSKNIGVLNLQTLNSIRATTYLTGEIYLNPLIPNLVSTTYVVDGGYMTVQNGVTSSVNLPPVVYPNKGISIQNSFQRCMNNYFNNFNSSKKITDHVNNELSLKSSLYNSIIVELLKVTGAKNLLDELS